MVAQGMMIIKSNCKTTAILDLAGSCNVIFEIEEGLDRDQASSDAAI